MPVLMPVPSTCPCERRAVQGELVDPAGLWWLGASGVEDGRTGALREGAADRVAVAGLRSGTGRR
ncbi:hypothetical protein [Streptomyces sp. NBC_01451]|uniref:hypothetical protein n=1 Tax=Streptomyces sp. NBC_01451 TaxID=2903872 RepID=UPI002E369FCE|nr:hypothetical protein [Streptomyces sp. NBC_01451]